MFDFDGRAISTVRLYADTVSAQPKWVVEISSKYDNGGALENVDVKKTTADDSVRVYVWDSLEGMRPLSGSSSDNKSEAVLRSLKRMQT